MPHRGQAHARRRACADFPYAPVMDDGTATYIADDFDDVRYDDIVPIRLRGTLVIDDNGEPAGLTDLHADRHLV